MATAKRVLFLGITGVGKASAVKKLAAYLNSTQGLPWKVINFEDDYLWSDPDSHCSFEDQCTQFLDSPLEVQVRIWKKGWERFSTYAQSSVAQNEHLFLCLHGCFLRGHYGARCVFNPQVIAEKFCPDLIFTLITDVYDMWWRTESRANNHNLMGRPSLEQLVFARRQELMVGDQIALSCSSRVKNLMFSVHHPLQTFAHCIIHPTDMQICYLSFPISQPRDLQKEGDLTAMNEVSKFIADAYEKQKMTPCLAIECPLGIDELPFARIASIDQLTMLIKEAKKIQDETKEPREPKVAFSRDPHRWDLSKFWPPHDRLGDRVTAHSEFNAEQLLCVRGNLETDVSWRDYRLVDQADFLVVFNPIFNNRVRMAGSVRLEVDYAAMNGKLVYIYQNPDYDNASNVWKDLGVTVPGLPAPQMSPTPNRNNCKQVFSYEELLGKLASTTSNRNERKVSP